MRKLELVNTGDNELNTLMSGGIDAGQTYLLAGTRDTIEVIYDTLTRGNNKEIQLIKIQRGLLQSEWATMFKERSIKEKRTFIIMVITDRVHDEQLFPFHMNFDKVIELL